MNLPTTTNRPTGDRAPAGAPQPSAAMLKLDEILARLIRLEAALEGAQARRQSTPAPHSQGPRRQPPRSAAGAGSDSTLTDHFDSPEQFSATLEAAGDAARSTEEREFVETLHSRFESYRTKMFISERQVAWLWKLASRKGA